MRSVGICFIFLIIAGCSTTNEVITSTERSITIRPRNDVMYEADRVAAAAETARAHCAKYGKSAAYESAEKSGRFYSAVTFRYE